MTSLQISTGKGRPKRLRIQGPFTWKLSGIAIITLSVLLPVILPCSLRAREDNARLTFKKMAGTANTEIYIVKKGDSIGTIFRAQLGDEPVPHTLIRQLNPAIKDLNRIYPGQRITLPIRGKRDPSEAPPNDIVQESPLPMATYRVREGDSISRIILSKLDASPEEVLSTYRLIRRLNPLISDLNHLSDGQLINLPRGLTHQGSEPPPPTALQPKSEKIVQKAIGTRQASEDLLRLIRPVISRMQGSLTALGHYFIPLKETAAQVTIDCSQIPVVELDDGSTILLDFGNRLSEDLKGLIRASWPNYAFLTAEELRDGLTGLQAVIRCSRNYRMYKSDKPLTVTRDPEILVFPDWIVAGKETNGGRVYRHLLHFLGNGDPLLPSEVSTFLEKNGFSVTEISASRAAAPQAEASPITAIPPDLSGMKGITLAEHLLKTLGESPIRNASIVIFEQARDGFNLNVTADLLCQKEEKRFMIHSKRLPEQFINTLQKGGTETTLVGETDTGRPLIEKVLRGTKIPFSFGYFSFMIPKDSNHTRLNVSFPALRTMASGKSLYLIDFNMSPDVFSLLQGYFGHRIAKY